MQLNANDATISFTMHRLQMKWNTDTLAETLAVPGWQKWEAQTLDINTRCILQFVVYCILLIVSIQLCAAILNKPLLIHYYYCYTVLGMDDKMIFNFTEGFVSWWMLQTLIMTQYAMIYCMLEY